MPILNVAGGVKLDEPAVDLAAAVSIASSFRMRRQDRLMCSLARSDLTGEVRAVSRAEQRVKEAQKLGFKRVIMPEKSLKGWTAAAGYRNYWRKTVAEALKAALG